MGNSAHCAWEDGPQRQAWSLDHTVVQCNLPYWKDWKGWKTHICNILHLCQWIYVFEELTMQVWVGSYCQHAFIDNAEALLNNSGFCQQQTYFQWTQMADWSIKKNTDGSLIKSNSSLDKNQAVWSSMALCDVVVLHI